MNTMLDDRLTQRELAFLMEGVRRMREEPEKVAEEARNPEAKMLYMHQVALQQVKDTLRKAGIVCSDDLLEVCSTRLLNDWFEYNYKQQRYQCTADQPSWEGNIGRQFFCLQLPRNGKLLFEWNDPFKVVLQ